MPSLIGKTSPVEEIVAMVSSLVVQTTVVEAPPTTVTVATKVSEPLWMLRNVSLFVIETAVTAGVTREEDEDDEETEDEDETEVSLDTELLPPVIEALEELELVPFNPQADSKKTAPRMEIILMLFIKSLLVGSLLNQPLHHD